MSTQLEITKRRIERLLDERQTCNKLHEDLLLEAEKRDGDHKLNEVEENQRAGYALRMQEIDAEVDALNDVMVREEKAAQVSADVRRHLSSRGAEGSLEPDGEFKYRTFAAYARDKIIVQSDEIANLAGGTGVREAAKTRLMRAPEHTLSSDVAGLQPQQHFAQILEVIDRSRPVVSSSRRLALERGQFTFPHVDQKPEVLLQGTQKTEAGTQNMQVSMETVTAMTFLGGGNLSWQAVNWSTPDALGLWFDMAAEQYARATEGSACAILTTCSTANAIGTADQVGTASTFADWISAIVLGVQEVESNSNAIANTLYLSPDMFYLAAALTSDSGAMLIQPGGLSLSSGGGNIAGINVVKSYGFASNTAIIGDSNAFLVAETAGAPVQLRVTEPSIAGFEVGVVGAFAAQCYDDNRFSQIS